MSNVWKCAIGPAPERVPYDGDGPLRRAVRVAFIEMFGKDAKTCASGWGFSKVSIQPETVRLTPAQREVVRRLVEWVEVAQTDPRWRLQDPEVVAHLPFYAAEVRSLFPDCFTEPKP